MTADLGTGDRGTPRWVKVFGVMAVVLILLHESAAPRA